MPRLSWDLLRTIWARSASCSRDFILQREQQPLGGSTVRAPNPTGHWASPGGPPQGPLLGLQGPALSRGQGLLRHRRLRALHAQPLLVPALSFGGPDGGAASRQGWGPRARPAETG